MTEVALRGGALSICVLGLAGTLAAYPILAWPLCVALLAYAVLLWRYPAAFLVVIPIVLPALDLGLWTGWMVVGESDLFILATIAVLVIRVPPKPTDLLPNGAARAVLLLLVASSLISMVIGLGRPLGYSGHSDNGFLRPDNALRLAKGLAEALVLFPFLHQRQRTHADALRWLAWGLIAGLLAVTLEVLVERMLFAGILDFTTDYRVAGPFSSMRVGGGHIGAYLAMALPFVLAAAPTRRFFLPLPMLIGVGGVYALLVTFARTAYAAALIGGMVAGLGLAWGRWRRGLLAPSVTIIPIVLLLVAVAGVASSGVMRQRFAAAAADLLTRESNWRDGWAVRDHGFVADAVGMGLGTYQRTMLSRSAVNRPSDLRLERDLGGAFASMQVNTPFYLGQKVVVPPTGTVRLALRFRTQEPRAALAFLLCDKVLLYSDNCQGGQVAPSAPGSWQAVSVALPTTGLGRSSLFGLVRRPVELSLFDPTMGTTIAVRDVTLTDEAGRALLSNGDFKQGLDRWLFTDDSHVSWRILNQYLMLLFETGVLGLVSFLALSGLALANGVLAAARSDAMGAAVAGSIASFLVSGLFDNVLEAPRVATLYFLVCCAGLLLGQAPQAEPVK